MTALQTREPAQGVYVALRGETDLDGFRRHARTLLAAGIAPDRVTWQVASPHPDLSFVDNHKQMPAYEAQDAPSPRVPAFFIDWVEDVGLHADPQRFTLLYRLLWRLAQQPALRHDALDPDRTTAERMARAVRRDIHKMKAFVRFRPMSALQDGHAEPLHIAWFEPQHHTVHAAAPFFARRFAQMHWVLLTPRACAEWDGHELRFSPGADRSQAPPADAGEALWLTYYRAIFNPSRLKTATMLREMPRRYWHNLPESVLIAPLVADAAARTGRMIEQPRVATARTARRLPRVVMHTDTRTASLVDGDGVRSLGDIAAKTQRCRECPLGALATQAVPGQGPPHARLMLVGEQPGDQEDLRGTPFVGPAGALLDRALAQLGWPREKLYITNAVKHFKYELRGKRRIHKSPSQREAAACLHWLEDEIALVNPGAIVALGATAARSLMGRPVAIMKERGQWLEREDGRRVLITLHPSALLRALPEQRERAIEQWIADLQQAQAHGPAPQ